VIRRRKSAIAARAHPGRLARLISSQAGMAALTPRADRIARLIGLRRDSRYVDIGCGTASFAHLLARRAGMHTPPLTLDLTPGPYPVDALAWPEQLPLADASVDALTSLYFIRRFDDDVVHRFADEISRVLAPGGSAFVMEIAPVVNGRLDALHARLVSGGCAQVDLRGWGRLAALFTECGFDGIDLVNAGPFFLPPIPRVGVLLRRASIPTLVHAPGTGD
jgi:SAM-dependent methyltransferase